jgi:hypothetical protein
VPMEVVAGEVRKHEPLPQGEVAAVESHGDPG